MPERENVLAVVRDDSRDFVIDVAGRRVPKTTGWRMQHRQCYCARHAKGRSRAHPRRGALAAVRPHQHAVDEMAEDALDIVDLETAILSGKITKTEKDDPRGTRYTIHGVAADGITRSGSVGRFTETGRYLIITAYEVRGE